MTYTTLLFDVKDHVAHITLNRPEALNAINLEWSRDLMHAILRCDEDPEIKAVLISAAGSHFCAGGDLKAFLAHIDHLPSHIKEVTTYFHAAISRMVRMDPPVIAAVHGYAVGAGMSLALACDILLAAPSARFSVAYTRVGLTPDGSMSYFLPRTVGLKRALELTLTNRMLTAEEASALGIVTRVIPEEELLAKARELALQLAQGPLKSFGAAKRLMRTGGNETLETQMEEESQTIAAITRTRDTREGIAAFVEKRKPSYRGE
ncbi:MAG: enoyl-CoA hydratase-related protein [Desulfobacterota bacterium]|nr:enoyl-CoA hydratase-related protein [Thermodesulfobacteriota bacterium]